MPDTFVSPALVPAPNGVRLYAAPPSLTARDREALHAVRRRYLRAVVDLDDAIATNRLDIALDALRRMSTDTDGQALAAAATLGSR